MNKYTNIQAMINKQRSWDENIWRLIVFAITIIIAVWVLGLLGYFYTQYQEEARVMSVMSSSSSTPTDLLGIDYCDDTDDGAGIEYDAVQWEYAVSCWDSGTEGSFEWDEYWQLNNIGDDSNWSVSSLSGDVQFYEVQQ